MLQALLGSHPSERCHPSPEPVGDHSLTSRVGPAGSPAPLHPAGPGGTHKHQHVEDEHQVLHAAQDAHGDAEGTGLCRQAAAGRQRLSLQRGELSPGPSQPRPVPRPGCSGTRGGPAHGHRRDRQGPVLREETCSWQVSPHALQIRSGERWMALPVGQQQPSAARSWDSNSPTPGEGLPFPSCCWEPEGPRAPMGLQWVRSGAQKTPAQSPQQAPSGCPLLPQNVRAPRPLQSQHHSPHGDSGGPGTSNQPQDLGRLLNTRKVGKSPPSSPEKPLPRAEP